MGVGAHWAWVGFGGGFRFEFGCRSGRAGVLERRGAWGAVLAGVCGRVANVGWLLRF